jgi:hypothetical protein
MHKLAALAEYLPATQLMQALRPAVLYVPAPQSMHTLAALAHFPSGH